MPSAQTSGSAVKKRRKRKKKGKNYYFHQGTEDAIILYNKTEDVHLKNKIYNEHIRAAFDKLCENIIHTFKFYYTDVEKIEDLKHELVSVLLEEKIMKFDPDNGAKAYSYFGTIVKRWLINYNNKNFKKLKQIGSFDETENYHTTNPEMREDGAIPLGEFIDIWVDEMYDRIDELFTRDIEKKIADAVLTIFRTRHDLDIFKKKALYIYIREMTDCETPKLTRVIAKLKECFYEKYMAFKEEGLVYNKPL